MFNINNPNSKGVSLYFSIAIMAILLAIALGISTILIGQIKVIKGMGDSVAAFYAADTGIERVMYAIRNQGYLPTPPLPVKPCGIDPFTDCWVGNPSYIIKITAYTISGSNLTSATINSIGKYNETNRAIETSW